ncbi:Redoxin [Schizopora paradoxa]|uniref:Putative peroxiredoxin n=1 Tax=Schizopora paradoxa TaxID=27342 RepID=A0A0H2RS75_9AGAM|nr:Redoxin [Schizopora paradoxa]
MSSTTIKVGDTVPEGQLSYIPYIPELDDHAACGRPITLDIAKEWKGKKVVLFSVPGAFTPTCHANHLPPYLQKHDEFKKLGVDVIAVLSFNDAFVMSGWGRFTGLTDKILCLSDTDAKWSESMGLKNDPPNPRTKRYALIIDDLKVKYIGVESAPGVTVSGAEAILEALTK